MAAENARQAEVEARFGFVYSAYHSEAWYWELAEMVFKLMLTGAQPPTPSVTLACIGALHTYHRRQQ